MKIYKQILLAWIVILSTSQYIATPFQSCPSKAFLMQQTTAKLFGVNLVTGRYDLLSDNLGTYERINAVGFNYHDNYIYGWGYQWGTLVQIGRDFQAAPLTLINNPGNNYYVGDVAVSENAYYFYRPGSTYGLYRASLDPSDENYLVVNRIIDGGQLNMRIFDLAFHPQLPEAYSVDSNGRLHRIDVATGNSEVLSNVGESGTFGAVYFDVEGNFYISRNSDGYVFRIDVSDENPTAEFFAYGPSSNNNDGARCAIAPVVDDSVPPDTDFGDAPESFGTTLAANGARHGLSSLYLGTTVDAEYDANVYPSSDELTGNDEDGILFITPFVAGLDSLVQISATGSGYLNVWADWDQDGVFSSNEKLISDVLLTDESKRFFLNTPLNALDGNTWLRARISSQQNIVAFGGVADGEVEDYRILVMNAGYTQQQHSPVYIAFEDNWPVLGDYDMNDVVIQQNSSILLDQNNDVVLLEINGTLQAMGAGYSNGYAIQLDGISPNNINSELVRFEVNGEQRNGLLEEGTDSMVLMIANNLQDEVPILSSCSYYRTESDCAQTIGFTFSLKIPFSNPISVANFPTAPFNPFIFASEGSWHGSSVGTIGRGLEIHLKNHLPTSKADSSLFGIDDDVSAGTITYQNQNGLPWALVISPGSGNEWRHPLERVDFLEAYPEFETFVTSNGASAKDWFTTVKATTDKLYQD